MSATRRKVYLGLLVGLVVGGVLWMRSSADEFNVENGRTTSVATHGKKLRIGIFMARAGDYLRRMAYHVTLMECYARRHGYVMIPNEPHADCRGPEWAGFSICWSRMCSMKKYFKSLELDWILVLDADSGMVNPNIRIEDFLPPDNIDMMFSVRWKSGEYCSGGYLLRNAPSSYKLLDLWLAYRDFNKNCVENTPLHTALLELVRPNSPHLQRCKDYFQGGNWPGGFEGFLKGFDSYISCVKSALGPGSDFGPARVEIIGQSKWFNTVSEDIGFKVTGDEFVVHGVKMANWFYTVEGNEEDVRQLKEKCMADPHGWKIPIKPQLIVSKEQIRRAVVRSDFEKTAEFPGRPIRPAPQVFDCWPNCEADTFYYIRHPKEEYKCINEKKEKVGDIISLQDSKNLVSWVDKCHQACERCRVTFN